VDPQLSGNGTQPDRGGGILQVVDRRQNRFLEFKQQQKALPISKPETEGLNFDPSGQMKMVRIGGGSQNIT
jgi:hypothetical protein